MVDLSIRLSITYLPDTLGATHCPRHRQVKRSRTVNSERHNPPGCGPVASAWDVVA